MRRHCGLCRERCDWNYQWWEDKTKCRCNLHEMRPHPLHDDGYGNLYALDRVLCAIDAEPGR